MLESRITPPCVRQHFLAPAGVRKFQLGMQKEMFLALASVINEGSDMT